MTTTDTTTAARTLTRAERAAARELRTDAGVQQDVEALRLAERAEEGDVEAYDALVACGLLD